MLEYPKSVLNCTINSIESYHNDDNHEEENSTVTAPNSFSLPSPPINESTALLDVDEKSTEINNSSFTLLERLEKIVPKNIFEVLKTVEVDSNELQDPTSLSI